MILFPGSNVEIHKPKIMQSKRLLDFGAGFYLTSDFDQAKKWAIRTTNRREEGEPIVSIFEIDETKFDTLNVLRFDSADKE